MIMTTTAHELYPRSSADAQAVLDFELKHKIIIDRFGRHLHRNAILGRVSSDAEPAFLTEPNSSF